MLVDILMFLSAYFFVGFVVAVFSAWWTEQFFKSDDLVIVCLIIVMWPVAIFPVVFAGMSERKIGHGLINLVNRLAGH